MNLPEGTRLTYIVRSEAWYWEAAKRGWQNRPGIGITASSSGGGCAWEFSIEEVDLGHARPDLLLHMFDDAWPALADIPEFFAALAGPGRTCDSLNDIRALLDRLGAEDETPHTSPYETS